MVQATMKAPEARLREEDLAVGKAWVHPDTKLEYEDFHAYLCGKDPIPHWRNAQIKRLLREGPNRDKDGIAYVHPVEGTGSYSFGEYLAIYFDAVLCTQYDRDGWSIDLNAVPAWAITR